MNSRWDCAWACGEWEMGLRVVMHCSWAVWGSPWLLTTDLNGELSSPTGDALDLSRLREKVST